MTILTAFYLKGTSTLMKMQNKTNIRSPALSYGLVFSQFLLIGLLIMTLDWQLLTGWTLLPMALAIALGAWSVWVMKTVGFNIVPDPHEHFQLIEQGPYHWIRHPMYSSILLFFWPCVLTQPMGQNPTAWLLMTLLTLVLLIKLHYEEQLLAEKVHGYRDYQQRTAKILPFIF